MKQSIWSQTSTAVKSHLPLILIIGAALLLELTSGVLYYSAQDIIHKTVEKLVEREMNAIYLCIRNKLAKVEVTVDNISWVVEEGLEEPEWMYSITQRLVKNNPAILGGMVAFIPNYFPKKGRWYEPYAVRRSDGTIDSISIVSDEEAERIIKIGTGKEIDVDLSKTFANLFTEQAKRTPDAPAVVDRDSQLTYTEMDSYSNALARQLIDFDVQPADYVHRFVDTIAGFDYFNV